MSSTRTLYRTSSSTLAIKYPPGLGFSGSLSLAPSLDTYYSSNSNSLSDSFYSSPNVTVGSGSASRKRPSPITSPIPSMRRRPAPPPPHSALSRVAPASVTSERGCPITSITSVTTERPPQVGRPRRNSMREVPMIREPTPRSVPASSPHQPVLVATPPSPPRMPSVSPPPLVRPAPDRASCARLVAGLLLHRSEPSRRSHPWPRGRSRAYVPSGLGSNVITAEA